jgi:hypothetical protein
MRRSLLLPFLLAAAAALPAQTYVTTGDANLTLAQVLRPHPEGLIISLPSAAGASLSAALGEALGQEPATALGLSVQDLDPGSAVAREIARLRGWSGDRPRWALVGPDRRVHAEGTEAPSSTALLEAYRQSGLRTRAEALREFLKEQPGHREAQARLLLELRTLGERRTARAIGSEAVPAEAQAPTPKEGSEKPPRKEDAGDEEKPKAAQPALVQLSDEADALAWGEYADRYDAFIREDAWLDASTEGSSPVPLAAQLSDAAERSPKLRALASRLLPQVEDRLRRKLSSERRWDVWLSLHSAAARGRASEVLAGIRPWPGARRWPPAAALGAFVEDARMSGDWREVEPLLQANYDQDMEFLQVLQHAAEQDAGGRASMGASFGFGGWSGEIALLVEAKLRLGKEADADRIVQDVFRRVPNPAIAQQASNLARKCGAAGVAERWERLASR